MCFYTALSTWLQGALPGQGSVSHSFPQESRSRETGVNNSSHFHLLQGGRLPNLLQGEISDCQPAVFEILPKTWCLPGGVYWQRGVCEKSGGLLRAAALGALDGAAGLGVRLGLSLSFCSRLRDLITCLAPYPMSVRHKNHRALAPLQPCCHGWLQHGAHFSGPMDAEGLRDAASWNKC